MTRYDIIYEELQDRVNCGMLTLEDAEVINDLAYDKYYFTEKKSRQQYAREKFKKRYNFQQEDDNGNYGTITVNGKKHYVDLSGDMPIGATSDDDESTIYLNKNFFKLKNGKRRHAVLHHEIGHNEKQSVNVNNNTVDKEAMTQGVLNDTYSSKKKELTSDDDDDYFSKAYAQAKLLDLNQKGREMQEYIKNNPNEKRATRISARKKMTPYVDPKTGTTRNEIEADLVASNRAGDPQLQRALRETRKMAKKDNAREARLARRDLTEEMEREKGGKLSHRDHKRIDKAAERMRHDMNKKDEALDIARNKARKAVKKSLSPKELSLYK